MCAWLLLNLASQWQLRKGTGFLFLLLTWNVQIASLTTARLPLPLMLCLRAFLGYRGWIVLDKEDGNYDDGREW